MNWRKPLILTGLRLTGSKIPQYLNQIKEMQSWERNKIELYQKKKLKELLIHAYRNVPYYQKVLQKVRLVKNEKIYLDKFEKLPFLTKDIIRKKKDDLYSNDYKNKNYFENTSGGSTGEPVKFIQDKKYWNKNVANKLFYAQMVGKEIGGKEVKLWGSERDILEGSIGIKNKVKNFIYNRKVLNAFKMTPNDMKSYVNKINTFQPKHIWTYIESIFELAKFIERNNLAIHSPNSIITTAGVLTEETRKYIEEVFNTKVYNQYGSREVGDIACECQEQKGLHIFEWSHFVEIINNKVIVTSLNNYSMPLIRYKIGDIANFKTGSCSCGRNTLRVANVTGRISSHFRLKDGSIVHGEYFTHLFYFRDWVKKFQVIQNAYDKIICKIVKSKEISIEDQTKIKQKIRKVMGKDCEVKFKFVDKISPSPSGKYLYTISEIEE